jgi:hypothetical protein
MGTANGRGSQTVIVVLPGSGTASERKLFCYNGGMNRAVDAEQFRQTVAKFQEAVRHSALHGFPTLAPIAREIQSLLGAVDLLHLQMVPVRTLANLTTLTAQAAEGVQFMIDSHPPDQAYHQGVGRPQMLERNSANINSRRGQLENLHQQIFDAVGPIVAHQQTRLLNIAAGPKIILDAARSIPPDRPEQVLWRYMPLRNLFRCERAGGLWLSSLKRLRAWSMAGAIPDIREGEVPRVVQRLKSDYWSADAAGPEAVDEIRERLGLSLDDMAEMRRSLDFSFELTNVFVSSWCQRRNETSALWPSFADGGRGVALKSTVAQLSAATWRAPIDLFGPAGSNRISALMLRDVQYLGFDDDDAIPSINDLHLPLLKPDTFSDEHEVRLLAFTHDEVPEQGFPLYCSLRELITEIVVGPNADFASTVAAIEDGAPDLRGITISRSKLAPAASV